MAETYSLAVTGSLADNKNFRPLALTLPDSAARVGSQQSTAASNGQVLCQGPDLGNGLYTIDAERSDPAKGLMYLLKVR